MSMENDNNVMELKTLHFLQQVNHRRKHNNFTILIIGGNQ